MIGFVVGFAAATAVEHFRPGTLSTVTLAVTVWIQKFFV